MSYTVKVSPTTNDLTLSKERDTRDEKLEVTISKSGPIAKVDVYFLSDTTGSMGPIIGSVQQGISTILRDVGGLSADLNFGVGNYKARTSPMTPTRSSISRA